MGLINDIKSYLYNNSLRKELFNRKVNRQSIDLEHASSIGILINASNLEETEAILKYAEKLQNQGKKVQILGFFDDKKIRSNLNFNHFNRKLVNFFDVPKGQVIVDFIYQPFDLLIICFYTENQTLEYIAANSKAHFRIGALTNKTHCFDVILNISEPTNPTKFFIKEMETILKKMNQAAYEKH